MTRVLIDTDVILDIFFDRQPHSKHSEAVLAACEKGLVSGYITPVMCSNLYYLMRRANPHPTVIIQLQYLLTILDVLSMDRSVVLNALHSDFKDFEDALQHHAAMAANTIDVIVTRNIKDHKTGALAVQTPQQFMAMHGLGS